MVALNLVASASLLAFLAWIYLKPLFSFTFDAKRYGEFHRMNHAGMRTHVFRVWVFLALAAQVFAVWFIVHQDLIDATDVDLSDGFFFAIIALAVAGTALGNAGFFTAIITMAISPKKVLDSRYDWMALTSAIFAFIASAVIAILIALTHIGVSFWFAAAGSLVYMALTGWYWSTVREHRRAHFRQQQQQHRRF